MKIKQATKPLGEISVFEERFLTKFDILYGILDLDKLVANIDANCEFD